MSNSTSRKGIILAGGSGTRLHPITIATSKQTLPIYNKPMIYYSLSVLMLANIKDILIISQSKFLTHYKELLGNGSDLGISIEYKEQDVPGGIPEAFIIGEDFIKEDKVALILGDNIFYGSSFSAQLFEAEKSNLNSIFCSNVDNRSQFGILEYNNNQEPREIIEKPIESKSNLAVTGLYFYENEVVNIAKSLKPSKRGELEITDINNYYLKKNQMNIVKLFRGTLWLDTGSFENLFQCSSIVYSIEKNTNVMIGSIEEIAFKKKWITKEALKKYISEKPNNEYYQKLEKIINSEVLHNDKD